MAIPPTGNLNTFTDIVVASATTSVAPAGLVVAIATIQATAAASHERTAAAEAISQQEQDVMAAMAVTALGADIAPSDLVASLTAIPASHEHAAVTALKLQLTDIIGVATPPLARHPAEVAASMPPLLDVNTFEASTITCLHA
jgi:hypothetical protein